jgi:hypothetical protein
MKTEQETPTSGFGTPAMTRRQVSPTCPRITSCGNRITLISQHQSSWDWRALSAPCEGLDYLVMPGPGFDSPRRLHSKTRRF